MIEELKKLTNPKDTNLLNASEGDETSMGSTDIADTVKVTDKADCDPAVSKEEATQDNIDECKIESGKEDIEVLSAIKGMRKDNDEINSDCYIGTSMSNADMSKAKADEIESDSFKVGNSVDRDSEFSSIKDCNGSMDAENLDNINPTKTDPQTRDTKTDFEVMDTSDQSKNVKEKPDCVKKEEALEQQNSQKRPCVVCLGILEEFTSDDFLQKIKVSSVDAGFEFTNYICSLMIPVSIILREHAIILYLKDTFGNVYDNVKFLDIPTIKDVWKWRNGPILKEILGAPFDQKSTFDIILNFVYPDSDRECSFLLGLMSDTFRKRKQDRRNNKKGAFQVYNRANVTKAVLEMSTKEFKSHFQCPPRMPTKPCTCDIKCQNEAIFIAGRYNKYSRTLSQTPWLIEGQRKSESSVEELICTEIDRAFKPTEHKFSSAGREDVDVLMLGDGRPFIVELTNPRRVNFTQEEMTSIQTRANDATKDIRVTDLQIVLREETEKLKEGEIDKIKNYSALCWSKSPFSTEQLNKLADMKDLKLLQKTPIRVLHRRPLSTREKCIHSMTVEKVDEYHFRLGLKTQAGTYIKEFVHGDFGRTKPNLTALLGVDCDILELNVQSVELDWPKKVG